MLNLRARLFSLLFQFALAVVALPIEVRVDNSIGVSAQSDDCPDGSCIVLTACDDYCEMVVE